MKRSLLKWSAQYYIVGGFTIRPPQDVKRFKEMVYANANDWAEKVAGDIDLVNSAIEAKSKPDSKSNPESKPESKSTLKSKSKK